jgi:8-amino-7-oxononanoate synthase
MDSAVAIIGVGARFPDAANLAAYRRLVWEGRVACAPVPADRWDHRRVQSDSPRDPNKTPARRGAFLPDIVKFAPEFFGVTPKRARIMDPQQRLMLEMSRVALEDAGYARQRLANGKVGVYVGASSSDHRTLVASMVNLPCDLGGRLGRAPALTADEIAAVTAALPSISAYSIVGQQLNMIAANVSQAFDFTGPAFAIDTACSSALAALHEAVWHLRGGLVDAALVGGVYVQLDPIMMVCFSRVGAISFTDACRPFQAEANGFVLGEGAGVVVLKRLDDAVRAGDRILAVVRGIGMTNDGKGGGPLTPRASGQVAAMQRAWDDAGIDPATVGMIEAHSTATPAGDAVELESLTEFFGARVSGQVPISSVKANIGHGLSSAGIASLIKATLAIQEGVVPPQPVAGKLREEFAGPAAWLRVPTEREVWPAAGETPRRAGVSAFGFGGTNVHVVLEARPTPMPRPADSRRQPFVFSAPNRVLLADYLDEVSAALDASTASMADVAWTLSRRRIEPVRVACVAGTRAELRQNLRGLSAKLRHGEVAPPSACGDAVEVLAARWWLEGENASLETWFSDRPVELVALPSSPLVERKYWLIDESKTADAPAAPSRPAAVQAEPAATPVAASGVRQLVVDTISATTAVNAAQIRMNQRFAADLGFDSLTTLEFVTALGQRLPGGPPPPRSLFTSALTVGELVDFLEQSRAAGPSEAVMRFSQIFTAATHPWLTQHAPGGRVLLPMAALLEGVSTAARASGFPTVHQFEVHAPVEVQGGRAVLLVETTKACGVVVRVDGPGGAIVATAQLVAAAAPRADLLLATPQRGALALESFYAEFGFHGPALRALTEIPLVGIDGVRGRLRATVDPVPLLDGVLQLGLYWLAISGHGQAMAVSVADFSQHAPWPRDGELEALAIWRGDSASELRGDIDLRDAAGALVAQWRDVRARRMAPAGAPAASPDWPEIRTLAARKAQLAGGGLAMPYFHVHEGIASATTHIAGRELINFSSYNYLGLAENSRVRAATVAAIERYGTSASASRIASGERPLHVDLERELAAFLGCEDAIALVSGHATNVSVIGHLLGPEDLVLHDSLAHDSIVAGARLSGARRLAFPHNDLSALAALLAHERPRARRALIAVEGVYSMDGDLAPLPEIVRLKRAHDALLLVDEAHSLGVIGSTGRGAGEHFGVARTDVDLWMGTLSKALASCGGYLAGTGALIDYLKFTLPGFVYSVGLSPANTAAALAALRELVARPELAQRLRARSDYFRQLCRERGIDIGASNSAAVVPCITGASVRALRLAQALGARGINVQPIFHPAVEEGRARLRFFVTAEHTEAQLLQTADTLAAELAVLDGAREGTRP